mmetsp:Transcript_16482/g.28256  ORF Transcript_16482/g.28256 Transcript_16482/m.28256 type:complete len:284 (+) Transcript_16482:1002-1853(+)
MYYVQPECALQVPPLGTAVQYWPHNTSHTAKACSCGSAPESLPVDAGRSKSAAASTAAGPTWLSTAGGAPSSEGRAELVQLEWLCDVMRRAGIMPGMRRLSSSAAATSRCWRSGTRSRSATSMRARTARLLPSSSFAASTRARPNATPPSTARVLALESVNMMLCRAPIACSMMASMGAVRMTTASASHPPASRMTRRFCESAAKFMMSCTPRPKLGRVKSHRNNNLTRWGTAPLRTICCRPSGTRAIVERASMALLASGTAMLPSKMCRSSPRMGDAMTSAG